MSDPIWTTWHYTPDEWRRFDAQEWNDVRQDIRKMFLSYGVLGLGAILAFSIEGFVQSHDGIAVCLFLPVASGVCMLIVALIGAIRFDQAKQRHTARQIGPPAITIMRDGLYEAGLYIPLRGDLNPMIGRELRLLDVSVSTAAVSLLKFRLCELGMRNNRSYEVRIPIPQNREAEAGALVDRFKREIIDRKNPPRAVPPPMWPLGRPGAPAATRQLPRPWVGGTAEAQRYGRSRRDSQTETKTQKLPLIPTESSDPTP
ncbi:MAG TPA: hypothetical protein VKY74_17210 [Chloroflexia bacterium]|nr:hypothetical protein [Chloroflexia bacterium]